MKGGLIKIMKFYSRITRQPESIITEVKDGLRVVSRKRLCMFENGVCEIEDPEIIEKLKKHPDKFRTDMPWPTNYWQDTEEGKKLLEKGKSLNIDIRHIRKEYLIKLIEEKEKGIKKEVKIEPKPLQFKDIIIKADSLGIKTHRRKKEDILKEIKEKEVI
jgi:hypothetical protein